VKSPHQLALEKARSQVRFRVTESWTWEEIQELADLAGENISTDFRVGYEIGLEAGRKEG